MSQPSAQQLIRQIKDLGWKWSFDQVTRYFYTVLPDASTIKFSVEIHKRNEQQKVIGLIIHKKTPVGSMNMETKSFCAWVYHQWLDYKKGLPNSRTSSANDNSPKTKNTP